MRPRSHGHNSRELQFIQKHMRQFGETLPINIMMITVTKRADIICRYLVKGKWHKSYEIWYKTLHLDSQNLQHWITNVRMSTWNEHQSDTAVVVTVCASKPRGMLKARSAGKMAILFYLSKWFKDSWYNLQLSFYDDGL